MVNYGFRHQYKLHWKPISWHCVSNFVCRLLKDYRGQCVLEEGVTYMKLGKYCYYTRGPRE